MGEKEKLVGRRAGNERKRASLVDVHPRINDESDGRLLANVLKGGFGEPIADFCDFLLDHIERRRLPMQCEAEILEKIVVEDVFCDGRRADKPCCEHDQIVIIFERNKAFLLYTLQEERERSTTF